MCMTLSPQFKMQLFIDLKKYDVGKISFEQKHDSHHVVSLTFFFVSVSGRGAWHTNTPNDALHKTTQK